MEAIWQKDEEDAVDEVEPQPPKSGTRELETLKSYMLKPESGSRSSRWLCACAKRARRYSLSLSLSHTLSLTLSHTHTHTHSLSHIQTLSLSHTLSHTHIHTHTLSRTHTQARLAREASEAVRANPSTLHTPHPRLQTLNPTSHTLNSKP